MSPIDQKVLFFLLFWSKLGCLSDTLKGARRESVATISVGFVSAAFLAIFESSNENKNYIIGNAISHSLIKHKGAAFSLAKGKPKRVAL